MVLKACGLVHRMCSSWLAFSTWYSSCGSSLNPNVIRSSRAALNSLVDIELLVTFNSCGSIEFSGSCTKVIRWRILVAQRCLVLQSPSTLLDVAQLHSANRVYRKGKRCGSWLSRVSCDKTQSTYVRMMKNYRVSYFRMTWNKFYSCWLIEVLICLFETLSWMF